MRKIGESTTFLEIQEKINQNKSVDFGDVFNNALRLFQKTWVLGLLMQLILFGVMFGIMFILYIPLMAGILVMDMSGTLESGSGAPPILLIIGVFVFYAFLIGAASFFSMGLQAAFFRQVRIKDRGLESESGVNWGMFFKKKYLKKMFLLSIAVVGIMIVSYILCLIPLLYTIVPIQFVTILFAFNPDLSIKELFEASFNIGTKKWGITIGLFIVFYFLAVLGGLLLCGIGVLFTGSFMYLPGYFIYKEVIGFYEDDEAIAQIGA